MSWICSECKATNGHHNEFCSKKDDDLLHETMDWFSELTLGVAMCAVHQMFGGRNDWKICMAHALGHKHGFLEGVLVRTQIRYQELSAIEAHMRDRSKDS